MSSIQEVKDILKRTSSMPWGPTRSAEVAQAAVLADSKKTPQLSTLTKSMTSHGSTRTPSPLPAEIPQFRASRLLSFPQAWDVSSKIRVFLCILCMEAALPWHWAWAIRKKHTKSSFNGAPPRVIPSPIARCAIPNARLPRPRLRRIGSVQLPLRFLCLTPLKAVGISLRESKLLR